MKSSGLKSSLHLARDNVSEIVNKRRKRLSKSRLINSLNRINFKDGEIKLNFKHNKYNHIIALQSKPQICNNDFLKSLWSEHFDAKKKLKYFTFQNFTFADGLKEIQVAAKLIELNKRGVYLELPDYCHEIQIREIKRYPCTDIFAQISQDGKIFKGNLTNFSAQSLGVTLQADQSTHDNTIDAGLPANVVLKTNSEFIFSGNCDIIRQNKVFDTFYIVFKPIKSNIQLFRPKEVRSERIILSPLPNILFQHPLIQKKIYLGLNDISGLGFSVEEDTDNAVLLPGMIIPELEIQFIHGFSVQCKVQVLYRVPQNDVVKCGLVILDMNMHDHLKLSSLINQAKNKHSYFSTANIDFDALWDFFFDSGFVYPEKYLHIAEQKEKFIATYKKLYNEFPEIVQHVIYLDKGKIYGHISIHRYYNKTWLLHHLAAIKSPKHKAGLVVLQNILQHINELHSLPSAKMNFLAGYFRPNNRFSNRLFGRSTVNTIDDLNKCSVDEFAYLYFQPYEVADSPSESWQLCESDYEDIEIMKHWYDKISGGLLIKALDLDPVSYHGDKAINSDYLSAGFKRSRKIFSLKKDDELLAIFIVNISDFGVNMSELTNCIQVFVLDQKLLRKEIVNYAIAQLKEYYEYDNVPVLLYPKSYAEHHAFSFEKTYMLGILNLEFIGDYIQFKNSLTSSKKSIKAKHTN